MKKIYLLMSLLLVGLYATAQEVAVVIDKLTAGELEKTIKAQGADPKKVTSLTVKSGDLNGTDIYLLRYMGGGDETGEPQKDYAMQQLDISGANIVTGGSHYISTNAGQKIYTKKDTIGSGMFINCQTLKSIKTPTSVTGIDGMQNFNSCRMLEQVTLSEHIQKIPSSCFAFCSSLASITLPKELKSIENEAFNTTAKLLEIVIPDKCTAIGEGAFVGSGLVKATLPKDLRELSAGAFANCGDLAHIDLPAEFDYIGEGAFLRCEKLVINTVTLSEKAQVGQDAFYGVQVANYKVDPKNTEYSDADGILFNKDKTSLIIYNIGATRTSYTIPASVTKLQEHAFYKSALTAIELPSMLEEIGYGCFHACIKLASLSLPDQIKVLPTIAFADCADLASVKLPAQLEDIGEACFMRCSKLTKLDLPNKLQHIGPQAFYFTFIEKLHLPASVNKLALDAFFCIGNSQSYTVDKANPNFCDVNGILFTKDMHELVAVPQEVDQKVLTLGSEVKNIWPTAVAFNHTIERVAVTNPDCKIESHAFYASMIKEIILPANLDTLKELTLNNCWSLQSCKFPDKLVVIGTQALSGCTSLQSLVLPATLETIENGAFSGCKGIKQIQCFAKEPPTCQDNVFSEIDCSKITLYVPTGSKAAYETAEQWMDFGKIVERDTPVSIEQTPATSVKLYGADGGIQVENVEQPQTLYIYQMSGQLVVSKKINGSTFVPLASGTYAIRIGQEAKIVNVK